MTAMANQNEPLLKVENLSAAYGGIRALNDVSIEVGYGETVSVLGANGAGKTTLLKCICRVMKPVSGQVFLKGKPVPSKPHDVVAVGLAHAPEGRQIFANLTVLDNLMVGAYLRKNKADVKKDLEYVYTLFPRLKEREKQYGGLLSGGEQQMLSISRALMAKPDIIMLDEPSLGLAPIIVNQIFGILRELKKSGTSILLVEQNAKKALSVSDKAYVLSVGHVVRQGSAEELRNDERLTEAYLGGQ